MKRPWLHEWFKLGNHTFSTGYQPDMPRILGVRSEHWKEDDGVKWRKGPIYWKRVVAVHFGHHYFGFLRVIK